MSRGYMNKVTKKILNNMTSAQYSEYMKGYSKTPRCLQNMQEYTELPESFSVDSDTCGYDEYVMLVKNKDGIDQTNNYRVPWKINEVSLNRASLNRTSSLYRLIDYINLSEPRNEEDAEIYLVETKTTFTKVGKVLYDDKKRQTANLRL